MFGIIKEQNGNVLLLGDGLNLSITPDQEVKQIFGNTIVLSKAGQTTYAFNYNQVEYYQILPAAKQPAPISIDDFTEILQTSFFFEAAAGEAGEITGKLALIAEASTAVVSSPTATVVFPNITEVSVLRLQPNLNCIVQGIDSTGITKQQVWTLINDSNFSITFPEENVNADPENRFIMQGTQKGCGSQGSYFLMYDLVKSRFRFLVN